MKPTDTITSPLRFDAAKDVRAGAETPDMTAEPPRDHPPSGRRSILHRLRERIAGIGRGGLRRPVNRALALAPRGFVPHDGLRLGNLSARLRVEWRIRDLHPWDRGLPADRRTRLLHEQTLRDTDAAIRRLFALLPEMEAMEIRVLEHHPPNRLILAGTVARRDADATRSLSSPGMRLRMMGIQPAG